MKIILKIVYRIQSLWKSWVSRKSHSIPILRIHLGACFILPLKKSKVAPEGTIYGTFKLLAMFMNPYVLLRGA